MMSHSNQNWKLLWPKPVLIYHHNNLVLPVDSLCNCGFAHVYLRQVTELKLAHVCLALQAIYIKTGDTSGELSRINWKERKWASLKTFYEVLHLKYLIWLFTLKAFKTILPYLKELANERKKTQPFQLTPSINCKQIPAYLFNGFHIWVVFKNRPSTKVQKSMYQFKNISEAR